ncbi:hypothetical protein [Acinetobacter sp.]|uniref:hypothetical protein n=1 Tax=Acinetobacter sp. TaxID=472 RepID=UPI00388D8DB2
MSHGYFITRGERVVLGFIPNAINFQELKPKALVPAIGDDEVLAYSVVKEGETRGFLWHAEDKHRAEAEAEQFTKLFGCSYYCVRLTHDQKSVDR